ncbi:MAG: hypothetical protein DRO67_00685 [Candidatus Asgardarchaeum californiense]|nr:MAG: hypothetical protein DRO67_00685 [Candidatus Asgardarchaeum californiense]
MVSKSKRKKIKRTVTHKECRQCGKMVALTDYHKHKLKTDGRADSCKKCRHERHIKNYKRKRPKNESVIVSTRSSDKQLRRLFDYVNQRINDSKAYEKFTLEFTLEEFRAKFEEDLDYLRIYNKWVDSDYDTAYSPSIDRIDGSIKKYTLENIQILTRTKNSRKVNERKGNYLGVRNKKTTSGKYRASVRHLKYRYYLGGYKIREHAAIAVNKLWDLLEADRDLVIYNKVPKRFYKNFSPNKALIRIEKKLKQKEKDNRLNLLGKLRKIWEIIVS